MEIELKDVTKKKCRKWWREGNDRKRKKKQIKKPREHSGEKMK